MMIMMVMIIIVMTISYNEYDIDFIVSTMTMIVLLLLLLLIVMMMMASNDNEGQHIYTPTNNTIRWTQIEQSLHKLLWPIHHQLCIIINPIEVICLRINVCNSSHRDEHRTGFL